jgi:uncharacterized protein (DUF697 family)
VAPKLAFDLTKELFAGPPMACAVGADGMSGLVYAIKFGTVVTGGINAHVTDGWELALWTVAVGGLAEQDGNN